MKLTCSVFKNSESVRMLVSEKLSNDDVRISSDHLKIFSIEFVLKPVLALVLATLADGGEVLPGTLVLARRAVPKQYHLKKMRNNVKHL